MEYVVRAVLSSEQPSVVTLTREVYVTDGDEILATARDYFTACGYVVIEWVSIAKL